MYKLILMGDKQRKRAENADQPDNPTEPNVQLLHVALHPEEDGKR